MIQFKSLENKLLTAFLVFGLVPLTLVGYLAYSRADTALEARAGEKLYLQAQAAVNAIDRNLFERYGDVQAFAANPLALVRRAEVEYIADLLTKNYGIYDLMIIADADGTIIAANTVDYEGRSANTSSLIGRSVRGKSGSRSVSRGRLGAGGTYYGELEFDAMTATVTGTRGLALNFSAPIFSESGEIVRVWSNRASWDRVARQIVDERIALLEAQGLETLEYQVLNRSGMVIEDKDPGAILKVNLAESGLEAAKNAVAGENGYTIELHKRLGIQQINGYAASEGALGFDGYGWSMLVRQNRAEAVTDAADIRSFVLIIGLVVAVVLGVFTLWIANGISGPIADTADALDSVAEGDYSRVLEAQSSDEVGRLAESVNRMSGRIREAMQQVQEAAGRETAQAEEQTEKVDRILQVVDAVAGGDYSRKINVHGSDAIGRLGEALTSFFAQKQATEARERATADKERVTGSAARQGR